MAWDAGSISNAAPWAALSQKLKDLISGGSGVGNWSFVKNIAAGTGAGQSGSTAYSIDLFRCRGATNLYKRIVQTNLGNTSNTTDGTSFTHTITTPAASRFITIFIANTKTTGVPDDPTSVALDGANAPTFTKIKSQAGGIGGTGDVKGTLWIGKSSGSAPTGTILTVTYGSSQTGCQAITDAWEGVDLTLGADGVDNTGATKIGIQVVGGNGTTTTTHSATLAAFLSAEKSVAVTWAAETASGTAYTTESGWIANAADNAMGTPVVHSRGMWRPNGEDTAGVLTSGGTIASWCCIAFEFQRLLDTGSITNANDAGKDFYFMIEIPTPDGAVTSSMNCAEDYDGFELFRGLPPTPGNIVPALPGYWRSGDWFSYASVTGNNRINLAHQALNTTGFSYWIKLTNNSVSIGTRIGASEAHNTVALFDSFVTNTADGMPLIAFTGPQTTQVAGSASFTRIPGVTVSGSATMWQAFILPWTTPTASGFTSNVAASQDLWSSQKIHVARVYLPHSAGSSTTFATSFGYARGVLKVDYLCFAGSGAVQLGDTMTIAGNTWTVIGRLLVASGMILALVTRAT